jgi:hypothetical protein
MVTVIAYAFLAASALKFDTSVRGNPFPDGAADAFTFRRAALLCCDPELRELQLRSRGCP